MKLIPWILFVAIFSMCFAATPVTKPPAKPVTKASVKKAAPRTAAKTPTQKGGTATGKSRIPARPTVASQRSRQAIPSPERYKEIQEALTSKGYLKSEASGVWDAQSVDALKKYQTDNKMQPTGKLTASALIGLGLGPKHDSDPAPPPPTTRP